MATNAKTPQEIAGRTGLLSPPKLVRKDWVLSLICSETWHWGGGYPFTLWFCVCVRSSNLIATRVRQQRFVAFLGSGNSNICYFQPDPWGKSSNFQTGWNHQRVFVDCCLSHVDVDKQMPKWFFSASWWCDKRKHLLRYSRTWGIILMYESEFALLVNYPPGN